MSSQNKNWKSPPPPLKKMPSCSGSKCERNLHCFRTNMRKKLAKLEKKTYRNGSCINCGKDVIDWDKVDKKSKNHPEVLLTSLKKEYIRNIFWNAKIDKVAQAKAKKKGMLELKKDVKKRLITLKKPSNKIYRDGNQTPWSGNVIYYGQHATATCCRKCMELWHKIPRNHPLREKEINYLSNIIMLYIRKKLPNLKDEAEFPIQKTK